MCFFELQRYDKTAIRQKKNFVTSQKVRIFAPDFTRKSRSVILALLIEYKVDIHVPPAEADAVLPSEESKQIPHTAPGGLVWG